MEKKLTIPTLKNYVFKRLIGQGAFSLVWEAFSIITKEKVAIKIVKKDLFITFPKFETYIRNVLIYIPKIIHPNVVRLLDFHESNESLFLVFEFCNSGDLNKYMRQRPRLLEEEALDFLKQLIRAFKLLNDHNIIHRDLKLENVLMNKNGQKLVLKLCDFDFLKKGEFGNSYCGTSLYMAPEILKHNLFYDNKTDLWSLGVMYYRLLTGTFPYFGESDEELIKSIEKHEVWYPPQFKISEFSLEFLRGALQRDPNNRSDWGQVYEKFGIINKEWNSTIEEDINKKIKELHKCSTKESKDESQEVITGNFKRKYKTNEDIEEDRGVCSFHKFFRYCL